MTEQTIKKILSRRNSFMDLGARMFIATKQNRTMPYEVTYNTTCFNGKIFDEHWQINVKDVERFEIA